METSKGLAPISSTTARILILGSLPGQQSLSASEYYAHRQNAFWPIMHDVFDICGDYETRCRSLMAEYVALWDVLQASERPGSMDADIRTATAVANDFETFLEAHKQIRTVFFNGKKAEQLFRRLVPDDHIVGIRLVGLPSTSPAYAAMSFEDKLDTWRRELTRYLRGIEVCYE